MEVSSMFNRREQAALLFLCGALLVGTAAAVVDHYRPAALEEFAVVPRAVPVPAARLEEADASGPVALNAADAGQLQRLPKTAARIVEYRRQHGPFQKLEDLQKVRGIGLRTVEKLRPLTVLE
jgi:competence protein ComEA